MIREQNLLSIHNSQISGFKVSQAVVLCGTTQTWKSLAISNNSIESVKKIYNDNFKEGKLLSSTSFNKRAKTSRVLTLPDFICCNW